VPSELIRKAAQFLDRGSLVSFPTETVYGLGADATNSSALTKLYAAKGRPEWHPVIVHLHSLSQIENWATKVPDSFFVLASEFWPGPLTMIVRRGKHVLDQVTGGQSTIGLRIPNHPIALDLLREFGRGIAAPSANKFGRISPTRAEDVLEEFGFDVALVLDGGPCEVGIESTIVDLTSETPRILRPGMILERDINAALCKLASPENVTCKSKTGEQDPKTVLASGMLPVHYAPVTPLHMVSSDMLIDRIRQLGAEDSIAVIAFQSSHAEHSNNWIVVEKDPELYARSIYANLRRLDHARKILIIVEEPPATEDWSGVRDRLMRASKKT
jgi:L-threonylcarbamoyladenylate synthase